MVDDGGMAARSADQRTEQPREAGRTWRLFALGEVVLSALVVAFDLSLTTIVILLLASISLAIRRTGPSSLGFRRVQRPGRMVVAVFVVSLISVDGSKYAWALSTVSTKGALPSRTRR